jgi:hypothetical protein
MLFATVSAFRAKRQPANRPARQGLLPIGNWYYSRLFAFIFGRFFKPGNETLFPAQYF